MYGLYAEDVGEIYPEMVEWWPIQDDPNKLPEVIIIDYDTRAILAVTVKEVQELYIRLATEKARNDAQDILIADLTKRIEVLETK